MEQSDYVLIFLSPSRIPHSCSFGEREGFSWAFWSDHIGISRLSTSPIFHIFSIGILGQQTNKNKKIPPNKQINKNLRILTTMSFFRSQGPNLFYLLLSTLHSIVIFVLCVISRVITCTYRKE